MRIEGKGGEIPTPQTSKTANFLTRISRCYNATSKVASWTKEYCVGEYTALQGKKISGPQARELVKMMEKVSTMLKKGDVYRSYAKCEQRTALWISGNTCARFCLRLLY